MLVRITNRCSMGCSHCMVEATADGDHMSRETFRGVLDLADRIGCLHLLISGGEPTDHPEILDMLQETEEFRLSKRLPHVTLLSNGLFLQNSKRASKILELVDCVQVTNDKRFYPKRVKHPGHRKVVVENHIRYVFPIGRALTNNLPTDPMLPTCFNLRSACRSLGSIQPAMISLWVRGKFCKPSINVDGTVVAGEMPMCHPIGKVDSPLELLSLNLLTMRCNRCGGYENFDERLQKAVGEDVSIAPGPSAW